MLQRLKLWIGVVFLLLVWLPIYSQTITIKNFSSIVDPYIFIDNNTYIMILNNNETGETKFNSFNDKSKFDMGVTLTPVEWVSIVPGIKIYDFTWQVKNDVRLHFVNLYVSPGITFHFPLRKNLTLSTWLANVEKVVGIDGVWAGLNTGLGIKAAYDPYYLSLVVKDEFEPLFKITSAPGGSAHLKNTLSYLVGINVFNYINEKVNSGIYVQGKFILNPMFTGGVYSALGINNVLFAGFQFNPLPLFKAYAALALYNGIVVLNNGSPKGGSNKFDVGITTGITFFYKNWAFKGYYMPRFYTSVDGVPGSMLHMFGVYVSVMIK